jgi:hypothetical protein
MEKPMTEDQQKIDIEAELRKRVQVKQAATEFKLIPGSVLTEIDKIGPEFLKALENLELYKELENTGIAQCPVDKYVAGIYKTEARFIAIFRITGAILEKFWRKNELKDLTEVQEKVKEAMRIQREKQEEELRLQKKRQEEEELEERERNKIHRPMGKDLIENMVREKEHNGKKQEPEGRENSITKRNKEPTPEKYIEELRQKTEAVDIEMETKTSRQNSTKEEKERQKRRRHITEKEEMEIEITLKGQEENPEKEEVKEIRKQDKREEDKNLLSAAIEDSIWSPSNRECRQGESYIANIPTYSVPGETEEERIRYVEFALAGNKHLKDIRHRFKRSNLWIEVEFDCKYGREEAIQRTNKKNGEWFRMLPEPPMEETKKYRRYREEREELIYQQERNRNRRTQNTRREGLSRESETKAEEREHVTIWDLPVNINTQEINYLCCKLGKVGHIRIKKD